MDDANVKRFEREIGALKGENVILREEVGTLRIDMAVAQSSIKTLATNQDKIMDNTDWTRKTVTQAVIVGGVSLVVTIVGGVFFFLTNMG